MRTLTRPSLLWMLLLFAATARAEPYEAREFRSDDGTTLLYRLLQPSRLAERTRYPLVLFLHGAGERGEDNLAQLKHGTRLYLDPVNRVRFPCYVVAPQCPKAQQWANLSWSGHAGRQPETTSRPTRAVLQLLKSLQSEFPIDADRIYLTGLSMGGYGAWDLITRFPKRFAAAVPVCGGGDEWTAGRAATVPIWAFHSEDDPVVKVDRTRNMIAVIRAAGGRPHYTEYSGLGHNAWSTAYREPEFLPWMFSQRLGRPDSYKWVEGPPVIPEVTELPPTDHALAGSGPIRRYGWFKNTWRERRGAWAENSERDGNAVVFLGDSITQGWGNRMGDSFPGMKVANRGISGDTTRGVILRLQDDVLRLSPRGVVLLIGTNDLEEGAEPETIADNVRIILAMLQAHNPNLQVILCRVFPSSAKKSRPSDKIKAINDLYAEIVRDRPQVTLIDTWGVFANAEGDAKLEEFPDLLHPNEAGYRKWAEALNPEFRRLGWLQ